VLKFNNVLFLVVVYHWWYDEYLAVVFKVIKLFVFYSKTSPLCSPQSLGNNLP
jgi:hypothetical protein